MPQRARTTLVRDGSPSNVWRFDPQRAGTCLVRVDMRASRLTDRRDRDVPPRPDDHDDGDRDDDRDGDRDDDRDGDRDDDRDGDRDDDRDGDRDDDCDGDRDDDRDGDRDDD